MLEALAATYGADINPIQPPSAAHTHPAGNQKLLEAIADTYGSDITPPQEFSYSCQIK